MSCTHCEIQRQRITDGDLPYYASHKCVSCRARARAALPHSEARLDALEEVVSAAKELVSGMERAGFIHTVDRTKRALQELDQ